VKQLTEAFRKELVQRIVRNLLDIQILRLIKLEPTWGYKIKQRVKADFDITLRHGALYPLLIELQKEGYLTSQRQRQGRRIRRVYAITEKGEEYIKIYNEVLEEQIK
jgi:PadR family transcriptional regulator PadR